jgi:hypothetical protein
MEASPTRQGDTGRSAILRRTGELHERRGRRGDAADPSRTDLKSSGGEHRSTIEEATPEQHLRQNLSGDI